VTIGGTAREELMVFEAEVASERSLNGRLMAELVLAHGRADGLLLSERMAAGRYKTELSDYHESVVRTADELDRHRVDEIHRDRMNQLRAVCEREAIAAREEDRVTTEAAVFSLRESVGKSETVIVDLRSAVQSLEQHAQDARRQFAMELAAVERRGRDEVSVCYSDTIAEIKRRREHTDHLMAECRSEPVEATVRAAKVEALNSCSA
jgi:hypothetical protein